MATQTSLVAQQVRIQQWAEQVRSCQQRPKGMDIATWCSQNNLTKANYYYHLRRVREVCLDQIADATPAFVELPLAESKQEDEIADVCTDISAAEKPVIRIKSPDGLSTRNLSEDLIIKISVDNTSEVSKNSGS